TAAAEGATATIPIVFNTGEDPVKTDSVAALNRPGGNATGISLLTVAMEAKRLQLLHELVPTAAVVAIIVNPNNPQADQQLQELQHAARTLGIQVAVGHELQMRAPGRLQGSIRSRDGGNQNGAGGGRGDIRQCRTS